MEVEIVSRKENRFLGRTELKAVVRHNGLPTPKRSEVREALGKALGSGGQVIIDSMHTGFGRNETAVYAKVYSEGKAAMRMEREHVLVRNGLAQKKKAEAGQAKQQGK